MTGSAKIPLDEQVAVASVLADRGRMLDGTVPDRRLVEMSRRDIEVMAAVADTIAWVRDHGPLIREALASRRRRTA